MFLTSGSAPDRETPAPVAGKRRWQGRLAPICFAVFAFEIGLFLVIFPWMGSWNATYFKALSPAVRNVWDDPFFRGALSGLGLVNIYVAFREVTRLLRGS
jgi:hypothetical protein